MPRRTLPGPSDRINIDDAPSAQVARDPDAAALPGGTRAGTASHLTRPLPGLARSTPPGWHRPARYALLRRGHLRCRRPSPDAANAAEPGALGLARCRARHPG